MTMETKFKATIDIEGFESAAGVIPLRYSLQAAMRLEKIVNQYKERIAAYKEKGIPVPEVNVSLEIDFDKRSLSANALMWAIYRIQAYYMNKELKAVKKIREEELYEKDMEDYADRHKIKCPKKSELFFETIITKEKGKIKKKTEIDGFVYFEIWETSSYWNTKKMAEFIQIKLYELEQAGITRIEDGNLDKVFNDFEKWKNQQEGLCQKSLFNMEKTEAEA